VEFELTTLVVIAADCIGSCKANYKNNDYWINNTLQRNWKRRVHKTKKNKTKTKHNMRWTPPCTNKDKYRKYDMSPPTNN